MFDPAAGRNARPAQSPGEKAESGAADPRPADHEPDRGKARGQAPCCARRETGERRHRQGRRALHQGEPLPEQQPHGGGDLVLVEEHPVVHEAGAEPEGDRALFDAARHPVGERRLEGRLAPRFEDPPRRHRGRHHRRSARLAADHPDRRAGVAQPSGHARDQAAAPHRNQHRIERLGAEGAVHFEPHRPLPGDDVRVVVGRHEGPAAPLRLGAGLDLRLDGVLPDEAHFHHLAVAFLEGAPLRVRDRPRQIDQTAPAEERQPVRRGPPVVPRGGGDHPLGQRGGASGLPEREQLVQRPPRLEGAGGLETLQLPPDAGAPKGRGDLEGGPGKPGGETLGGRQDPPGQLPEEGVRRPRRSGSIPALPNPRNRALHRARRGTRHQGARV